jgi:2-haloacid dehalogenase
LCSLVRAGAPPSRRKLVAHVLPIVLDPRPEALTFDCYGTLIDWERGIADALRPILERYGRAATDDQVLELFAELESAAEAGPYLRYREVLRRVLEGVGERLGFEPSEAELAAFAGSVPEWPPFADTAEALTTLGRRYRLVILSNVDDDLIVGTLRHLPVDFHLVMTAEQIGSYKPSPRNFEALLEQVGLPQERILHVAQSLFHDIAPARRLGLRTVWVNRRAGRPGSGATAPSDARPDFEVPDLRTLAKALA